MRVGLFTPYDLTPGGGERVLLTIAQAALEAGADVYLLSPHRWSKTRVATIGSELGVPLAWIGERLNLGILEPGFKGQEYQFDKFFCLGNETIPQVMAQGLSSYYICQFPFDSRFEVSPNEISRIRGYEKALVYSHYVARQYARRLSKCGISFVQTEVLYPGVEMIPCLSSRRKRIISVGRFFRGGHSKRQDAAIEIFKALVDSGSLSNEWELVLAGSVGSKPADHTFVEDLRSISHGYRIHIELNVDRNRLRDLYQSSTIYWHLGGFQANPLLEPENFEHFGITVVEAMASGCVPVVFAFGGPAEIVDFDLSLHWSNEIQLRDITRQLSRANETQLDVLRKAAVARAHEFSDSRFRKKVRLLLADHGNHYE